MTFSPSTTNTHHTYEHIQIHRHKHTYKDKEIIKYILKTKSMNGLRAWWSTTVILSVRGQRQEDLNRLEVRLIYTVNSRLPSYAPRLSQTNKKCKVRLKWSIYLEEICTPSLLINLFLPKLNFPTFPNLILSLTEELHTLLPLLAFIRSEDE